MSIDEHGTQSEPASANKTAESAALEQATAHVWGRLSPWSILHFVARAIVQILSNAIALVPLIVGLSRADSPLYVALGALFTIVAVVAYACLRYLNYWYQLDPDSVQVRQGIFTKAHLNLRFRRIQNVTIEHPFYFRPFGLVTVVIEGAGSAGEEVQLAALEVAVAEAIATTIRAHQTQAVASTSDAQEAMPEETVILRRSLGDLVLHGLTNNRAWIILGGVAALYGQAANTINQQVLPALGIDVPGLAEGRSFIELGLLAIGVMLLALVLMSMLSVLGSIVAFYGYTLIRTSEGFKVQRGLLTKHDVSVRRSRIQGIAVHRDWLDMMLGRMNVLYEQIAHAIGGQSLSIGKRITIPSVEPDHCAMLQAEALGIVGDLTRIEFVPANIRYWRRLALTTGLPYVIVGSALSFSDAPLGPWPWLLVPAYGVHQFLNYWRWRRWGLAIAQGHVVVRYGVFGVNHAIFPAFKIQQVGRQQTPFMARAQLSTLRIVTASRSLSVPYLPAATVSSALQQCLYDAEATNRSWM